MLFKTVTLPVFEHLSNAVRAKNNLPLGPGVAGGFLSAGSLRIAGAVAKTIYADPQISSGTQAVLSAQAFANLQWLSTSAVGADLRLIAQHTTNELGLRDFSRGSRVGEYGQGLCALFMQDQLGLPIVLDFGVLCSLLNIPRLRKIDPQPDFAGWLGPSYTLVESKASLEAGSVKTELRDGLEQCDAGVGHLTLYKAWLPSSMFSVLTAFQTELAPKGSVIHFADPTRRAAVIPDDVHNRISKHYYRTALAALGASAEAFDFRLANRQFRPFTRRFFPRSSFEFIPLLQPPAFLFGSGRPMNSFLGTRVYVDRRVMDALRAGQAEAYSEAITQWRDALAASDPGPESNVVAWADGIVLEVQSDGRARRPEFLD